MNDYNSFVSMNIADEKILGRAAFSLFLVSLICLFFIAQHQERIPLEQHAIDNHIINTSEKRYVASGIVQSVRDIDDTTYVQLQTFCTLYAQYDQKLLPSQEFVVGDFIQIEGFVKEYNGEEYVQISQME